MASNSYTPAPDPADANPDDYRGRRGRFVRRGDAFVAVNATVVGAVELGPDVNIWFGCVLRGDDAPIRIGARTNVQDLTVIHADPDVDNVIGRDCVIGHRVVLHGARVGDGSLIGMGAILLGGSVIGEGSLVGAGTLIRERMVVPPRSLVVGVPGKVIGSVPDDVLADFARNVDGYIQKAKLYL